MPGPPDGQRLTGSRRRHDALEVAVALAWCVALATVIIGPMAGKGWVALLDWATGPRVAFAGRITTGDSLPAGPVFFGLAALLHGVFGAAAGWILPWLTLLLAGLGAARLASFLTRSRTAHLTASTAFVWNPFVHERLYSGQLAVLLGYAVLPFVAVAALKTFPFSPEPSTDKHRRLRGLDSQALRLAVVWAIAAAASIHFAVLGAAVVAAVAVSSMSRDWGKVRRRLRAGVVATVAMLVITVAWLGPKLSAAPPTGDSRTVAAFATRPDPQVGLLGGVALQRGFWRSSPDEPSSDLGWWWPLFGGALGGAALLGFGFLSRKGARTVLPFALLGGIGWLLGQGSDGVMGGVFDVVSAAPGLRIMREAGKFISLLSLAWTVGLAGFADRVSATLNSLRRATSRVDSRVGSRLVAVALLGVVPMVPAVLTPTLAWGVQGRLAAVSYPPAWATIRVQLDRYPSGRILVLPFTGYYDPGFTNGRVVKHLGAVYFGSRVIHSDDAQVPGLLVGQMTASIAGALRSRNSAAELAELGVGFIVAVASTPDLTDRGFARVHVSGEWAIFQNLTFSGDRFVWK